ncbi:MAG: integral membrane sensor hybrid histidine kinase [Comamonadaceae bacterium]|nr:MAG: integral membrane sensor hybrid histidine kinase [Comamonadaceae bacterium]
MASLLGGSQYQALAIAAALYLAALLGQARNTAQATRAAIQLRFDNTELLEQLRFKTAVAESARLEAEAANSAKSKFLAAASHDLRQPIHAQGLFLAVLARTELTPHQQVLLSNARAASADSRDMLNKLLDFSRIEAGVIEPNLQPVGLQSLLHKIERDLAPQANEKDLVYRSRETHLSVRSDPVLLELILRNLVSNAIRYTERGGILVACRQRGDQVVLEVWDTGMGIAIEQQQAIFREFHQLGNPERDRSKGLGLGLAIAERLTQSLGHRLSLVSTPQRGSVFRLALPLVDSTLSNQLEPTAHIPVRLLNARVLVVDDDAAVCFGMLHLLRDWGCICVAAQSIEEALVIANEQALDLLICDYRLRGHRTGSECIVALRALLGQDKPALLVTGDTAPERLREAQGSGIPLLHKPVSPGQLYRRLVEILEATALAPERAPSAPVATPH